MNRLNAGMIEEIKTLHDNGLSWERMESFGLEYRYVSRFLRGLMTRDEMEKRLELEICHYAKRQNVWFKRNKKIEWIIKD